MKNKKKFGFTAIIAVIALAFALTACILPEEDGDDVTDFEYYEYNGQIRITKYVGEGGDVTIPSKIGGKPVTEISQWLFYSNKVITSVTIPGSVTVINDNTFVGCSNLTSVTIGNGVTAIGSGESGSFGAFEGCTSLTSITIPDSVTSIKSKAFLGCSSLASITIPNGVTIIEYHTFRNCNSLTRVTIPDNVTTIKQSAFENTGLTSVTIPNSVISIEGGAFSGTNLTSVTLGNHVTSLDGFTGCDRLTSITIPASVTSIWPYAFENCTGLTSVTFQGTIPRSGWGVGGRGWYPIFPGNLGGMFYETDGDNGTPGTYTRPSGSDTWTLQE